MIARLVGISTAAILAGCSSAPERQPVAQTEPEPPRTEFRLRATVTDVDIIPDTMISGVPPGYILCDWDAMFGVGVRVISMSPRLAGFEKGRTVFFAVHAPVFIWQTGENPKGKTYDFILRRPGPGSKRPWWDLELGTSKRPNQAM